MSVTTKLTTYPTGVDQTLTAASLVSDTNLVAGREMTAFDNTSNLFLDVLLFGKFTTGTGPTVNTRMELWLIAKQMSATPAWTGGFTGSDANLSVTSRNTLISASPNGQPFWIGIVSATSNVAYPFFGSVAKYFGGTVPPIWTAFLVHNTAVNLNSTGSNHIISTVGISATTT